MSSLTWQMGEIKDFAVLLLSAFFMYTYNIIFMVATPLLVTYMGGTEILAGLQGTVFLVTAVILRFFFGPLADTYSRRSVMLIGSGAFLLAGILFVYGDAIWQVIALRIVQAVGLAAYFPAASATAAACAKKGRSGTCIGILRMVSSLSLILGPFLALYAINEYGYLILMRSMVLLALGGMGTLCFISGKVAGNKEGVVQENKVSLRQKINFLPILKKSSQIVITTFVVAFSYGIYMSFAIPYVVASTTIKNAGLFFTAFSCGGIIANGLLGFLSDRFGPRPILMSALFFLGSSMILFSLLPQMIIVFYPAGFLAGFGYYGCTAVLMAWLAEKVATDERTSAFSLQQNALDFGIAAGSGIFGILLAGLNNASVLYGFFGVFYLCYIMISFWGRRHSLRYIDK